MGSYTSNLKFYKPESKEFVDVESQINANWRIADSAVKRLLEYELTDSSSPPVAGALDRSRFFKRYSNAAVMYRTSGGSYAQDPSSKVTAWTRAGSLLNAPYVEHPDWPLCWRLIVRSGLVNTSQIEWTGAIWIGGDPIPANTNATGVFTLPAAATPTVSKYFTVNAGNATGGYSIARIGFFSTTEVQFKRYGAAAGTGPDENRIEFSGIKYCLEVPA